MSDYTLSTKFSWTQVYRQVSETFNRWGVVSWDVSEPRGTRSTSHWQSEQDRTVELFFKVGGKDIRLKMGLQDRAVDNFRVLAMTVEAMRMNQVRGIDKVMSSAYLQIEAPQLVKDPYDVLGLPRGTALAVCEAQYKEMVKQNHPDRGGSINRMQEINEAIEKIRKLA